MNFTTTSSASTTTTSTGNPMHQRRTPSSSSSIAGRNHNNGSNNSSNNNNNNMYNTRYDVEGGSRGRRGAGGGGAGYSDTNSNIMEQQNNERINELSEHVARLKGLTIDIGNEVREQNALLDGMSDGFANTRDMLAGSLRRIGTMLETSGGKHMCTMVGFAVLVLIFLWWLMKRA